MPKFSQFKEEKNVSVQDIYEKYKDLGHDELSNTLIAEVCRQKQNGTFDYDKLCEMIDSVKGYLSPETYENVKRIMQTLK